MPTRHSCMARQDFRVWVGAVAAMFFFFADLAPVEAQGVAACPESGANLEQQAEEIACLRDHAAGLKSTQELLEQALLDVAEDLEFLSADVNGPAKDMRPIEAVEGAVLMMHAWGGVPHENVCVPVPDTPEGSVRIGGGYSTPLEISSMGGEVKTRHPDFYRLASLRGDPAYCNDLGGRAIRSLASGCFVRAEWYEWYRTRSWFSHDPVEVCR